LKSTQFLPRKLDGITASSSYFEGKSIKVNDVFCVRFPNGHLYKIRIAESDPTKRIVWDVIDAYQGWVKNTPEWAGTRIVWEIKDDRNGGVSIDMTHVGLVPQIGMLRSLQ
jgi:hypothetical protein